MEVSMPGRDKVKAGGQGEAVSMPVPSLLHYIPKSFPASAQRSVACKWPLRCRWRMVDGRWRPLAQFYILSLLRDGEQRRWILSVFIEIGHVESASCSHSPSQSAWVCFPMEVTDSPGHSPRPPHSPEEASPSRWPECQKLTPDRGIPETPCPGTCQLQCFSTEILPFYPEYQSPDLGLCMGHVTSRIYGLLKDNLGQ